MLFLMLRRLQTIVIFALRESLFRLEHFESLRVIAMPFINVHSPTEVIEFLIILRTVVSGLHVVLIFFFI